MLSQARDFASAVGSQRSEHYKKGSPPCQCLRIGLLEGLLPAVEHRDPATDPEVQEQEDDQRGQASGRQRVQLLN